MSLAFPLLLGIGAIACALLLSLLEFKDLPRYLLWGGFVGLFISSFIFGMIFAHDAFKGDDMTRITMSVICLYGFAFSLLAFLYTRGMHKAFGISFLSAVLIFGLAFLILAFTYGRVSLDNEEIISSSTSAIRLILPLIY